jgi:hypothetical protein
MQNPGQLADRLISQANIDFLKMKNGAMRDF